MRARKRSKTSTSFGALSLLFRDRRGSDGYGDGDGDGKSEARGRGLKRQSAKPKAQSPKRTNSPGQKSKPKPKPKEKRKRKRKRKRKILHKCAGFKWSGLRGSNPPPRPWQGRALPNELNPQWCLRSELNQRHGDFQSPALPTELQRRTARVLLSSYLIQKMATRRGLEPLTSSVTG